MARSPLSNPALFLLLASTILLWLCTFSTADGFIWGVYFLQNNRPDGGNARFGTFGWCVADYCIPRTLGWVWEPQVTSEPTLTRTLVLVPIATGFSTLALFCLIHTVRSAGGAASPTLILTLLTLIASSMAVGFVFGVFDTARKRFSSDGSGVAADFGPAAWMLVAATASLLICLILIYVGPYKRAGDYEVVENKTGVIVTSAPTAAPAAVAPPAVAAAPATSGGGWASRFRKTEQTYTV